MNNCSFKGSSSRPTYIRVPFQLLVPMLLLLQVLLLQQQCVSVAPTEYFCLSLARQNSRNRLSWCSCFCCACSPEPAAAAPLLECQELAPTNICKTPTNLHPKQQTVAVSGTPEFVAAALAADAVASAATFYRGRNIASLLTPNCFLYTYGDTQLLAAATVAAATVAAAFTHLMAAPSSETVTTRAAEATKAAIGRGTLSSFI